MLADRVEAAIQHPGGLGAQRRKAVPVFAAVYVFSNRRRNRVKILAWERNDFWLLLKRLEQDRFIWPDETTVPTLTVEQLHWLLDGIDLAVTQRHPQRIYERVA